MRTYCEHGIPVSSAETDRDHMRTNLQATSKRVINCCLTQAQ
jgi:hypothetical protein